MKPKNKYPAPSTHPTFISKWNGYIDDIASRENFKPGHLNQLQILCDLHVEYENLRNVLEMLGHTYESIGRNGFQVKMRPEIEQRTKVIGQIAVYSKMLGLILKKDKEDSDDGKGEFE
jgi:hypothetical protein